MSWMVEIVIWLKINARIVVDAYGGAYALRNACGGYVSKRAIFLSMADVASGRTGANSDHGNSRRSLSPHRRVGEA